MVDSPREERKLEMKYAGGLIRHLGLQMYSGAVPAIAELISNAWDADSARVDITLPLDTPMRPDLEVRVRDYGHGMTFDEVNDLYLLVGRNRRSSGKSHTPGGRPVLGRKGIGKLAGFGIARLMEVWTVKDGHLTAFTMDYEEMTRHGEAEMAEAYEPPLIHDRAVESSDPIQEGTLVVLKRLRVRQQLHDFLPRYLANLLTDDHGCTDPPCSRVGRSFGTAEWPPGHG